MHRVVVLLLITALLLVAAAPHASGLRAGTPDPDGHTAALPAVDDPRFDEQWALRRLQVPEAWAVTQGAPFVVVAVIDTGVDLEHPDLRDRLVPGFNFLDPEAPPQDDAGHGTHAAGIIAATANNETGIAGVAPNVTIMPLKVLDREGIGQDEVGAAAIRYAVDHGAWVVNLSATGTDPSPALEDAVAYAAERGVVLVAAAGNARQSTPVYPAAIKPAIAVGATNRNDARWQFSNFGPWVDIAGPGESIVSTSWDAGTRASYHFANGTSAAAAFVSGVIALMFSVQPMLTVDEVIATLRATADPLPDHELGAGRVNALGAVLAVTPPVAESDPRESPEADRPPDD